MGTWEQWKIVPVAPAPGTTCVVNRGTEGFWNPIEYVNGGIEFAYETGVTEGRSEERETGWENSVEVSITSGYKFKSAPFGLGGEASIEVTAGNTNTQSNSHTPSWIPAEVLQSPPLPWSRPTMLMNLHAAFLVMQKCQAGSMARTFVLLASLSCHSQDVGKPKLGPDCLRSVQHPSTGFVQLEQYARGLEVCEVNTSAFIPK